MDEKKKASYGRVSRRKFDRLMENYKQLDKEFTNCYAERAKYMAMYWEEKENSGSAQEVIGKLYRENRELKERCVKLESIVNNIFVRNINKEFQNDK